MKKVQSKNENSENKIKKYCEKERIRRHNINSISNNNYCTFDSSCSINCNIDRGRWNIR